MTFYDSVREWHSAFDVVPTTPHVPFGPPWERRIRLILEELAELARAQALHDLPAYADALVDLTWVVLGTAVESGMPFDELWKEVQRANHNKLKDGAMVDANGKVLKPDGWRPPDIEGVLRRFR